LGRDEKSRAYLVFPCSAWLGCEDKVATVNFVESSVAVNTYPIAAVKAAPKPDLAKKFVDLVAGEYGQKVLSDAGFAKP
jgi:molybdate transport system substrate-binding protein